MQIDERRAPNAVIEALRTTPFDTAPPSIVEALARAVRDHGTEPALRVGDDICSWATLDARSDTLARGLKAHGVDAGAYVTISLHNGIDFVETVYAIWKIGAIPQPVSWRLPIDELRAIVELADSALVVACEPLEVGRRVVSPARLREAAGGVVDLTYERSPSWKAPTSGGSTGRPKLIVSGSPAVLQERMIAMWRLRPSDVVLMPGPLYHNAPFSITFPALMNGTQVIVMGRFDAEETLRIIAEQRVTFLYLVPTMMTRIMKLPAEIRGRYDVSSLRMIWHMAAPCPAWLKRAWIDWVGPEVLWELYGGTEGVAFTVLDGNEWLAHPGSVGTVASGLGIEAFAPGGDMLPRGHVGELYMKHDAAQPLPYRYVGADDRTLEGDWYSIGNFGWLDDGGYLFLADRRSDLILVGGANVYPAEVEAIVDQHPAVQSSCVIGLPDEDLGARVHAIVHAGDDLDEAALRSFLSGRLSKPKMPKSFEFVREPLRDEAGKIRRSALREARLATGAVGPL